jgi:hypothetical protein
MSGDGGTLESLHGINQHLITKLQGAGIQSISDLATKSASELLEDYYSNYDENDRGIDEATINFSCNGCCSRSIGFTCSSLCCSTSPEANAQDTSLALNNVKVTLFLLFTKIEARSSTAHYS